MSRLLDNKIFYQILIWCRCAVGGFVLTIYFRLRNHTIIEFLSLKQKAVNKFIIKKKIIIIESLNPHVQNCLKYVVNCIAIAMIAKNPKIPLNTLFILRYMLSH